MGSAPMRADTRTVQIDDGQKIAASQPASISEFRFVIIYLRLFSVNFDSMFQIALANTMRVLISRKRTVASKICMVQVHGKIS